MHAVGRCLLVCFESVQDFTCLLHCSCRFRNIWSVILPAILWIDSMKVCFQSFRFLSVVACIPLLIQRKNTHSFRIWCSTEHICSISWDFLCLLLQLLTVVFPNLAHCVQTVSFSSSRYTLALVSAHNYSVNFRTLPPRVRH